MLPRWHVVLGLIFTSIIWYFAPNTSPINLILVFLASFLIDFDHYLVSFHKTKKLRLRYSFEYHIEMHKREIKEKKKGIRKRGDFHLFHTVEFQALIGLLGIFFLPLFYIFLGMVFHSLIDLFYLLHKDRFYRREYFFFNWIIKKLFR